jgi:hypothetical protein
LTEIKTIVFIPNIDNLNMFINHIIKTTFLGLAFASIVLVPTVHGASTNYQVNLLAGSYLGIENSQLVPNGMEIQPKTHETVLAFSGDLKNLDKAKWYKNVFKENKVKENKDGGVLLRLDKDGKQVMAVRVLNEQIIKIDVNEGNSKIVVLTKKGVYKFTKDLSEQLWFVPAEKLIANTQTKEKFEITSGFLDHGNDGSIALLLKREPLNNKDNPNLASGWISRLNPDGTFINSFILKDKLPESSFNSEDMVLDTFSQRIAIAFTFFKKISPSTDTTSQRGRCDTQYNPEIITFDLKGNKIWANYENFKLSSNSCNLQTFRDLEFGRDGFLYGLGYSDEKTLPENNVFTYDPLNTNIKSSLIKANDDLNVLKNNTASLFVGRFSIKDGILKKGQFFNTSEFYGNYQLDVNDAGQVTLPVTFDKKAYPGKGQLVTNNIPVNENSGSNISLAVEMNSNLESPRSIYNQSIDLGSHIKFVSTRGDRLSVFGLSNNSEINQYAQIQPRKVNLNDLFFNVDDRH